jgi:hypothetical protein
MLLIDADEVYNFSFFNIILQFYNMLVLFNLIIERE